MQDDRTAHVLLLYEVVSSSCQHHWILSIVGNVPAKAEALAGWAACEETELDALWMKDINRFGSPATSPLVVAQMFCLGRDACVDKIK